MSAQVKAMLERWGAPTCGGVAAIVTLALLWQVLAFTGERSSVGAGHTDNPAQTSAPDDYYERLNERVRANNVFAEPDPDGFQGELTGILGEVALFGGDTARVGERVSGATVTAIGPDWADIEFDGETKRLWVFGERAGAGDDSARPSRPDRAQAARQASTEQEPRGRSAPSAGAPGGRGEMPPGAIERLSERLEQMDPEQRERMIERLPSHIAAQLE